MSKKYVVRLKSEERALLLDLTRQGQAPTKALTHARILLKRMVSAAKMAGPMRPSVTPWM